MTTERPKVVVPTRDWAQPPKARPKRRLSKFDLQRIKQEEEERRAVVRLQMAQYDTQGEQVRFLRESGLQPEDAGISNWVGAKTADPDVLLHQAIYGENIQQFGRTWGTWGSSAYLTTKQFRKGYDAIALANSFGEVLNAFICISWSTVGITEPAAVMEAQKRYLELLRKWGWKRGVKPAWVWVIENGSTWGIHSHILAAVPHAMREQLKFQVAEAVATIAGRPIRRKRRGLRNAAVTVRVVHKRDTDVRAQWRLFQYMMKGLRPTKRDPNPERRAKQVVMEKIAGLKLRPQGELLRQRFGVSRGLNTKFLAGNREAADLPPNALERGETRPEMLFTDEYLEDWNESQRPRREAEAAVELAKAIEELTRTLHI